jgi:hypothetical protein
MDNQDKSAFASVLRATFDVYGKEVSTDVMRIWWAALETFSIDEVRIGFSRYIRSTESGQFPPKPADIIKMVEGTGSDRGMIAWSKVHEAIKRVGAYRSVVFDDPLIHVVIEGMGGWAALCMVTSEELPFRAQEFSKRYRAYAERGELPQHPACLTGIAEASNRLHGFPVEPPVLLGNPEKAAQVLALGCTGPRLQITSGNRVSDILEQGLMKQIESKKGDEDSEEAFV